MVEYTYPSSFSLDPRVVYIADRKNHCVRRIKVRQANVDTFAGVCGVSGFTDGLLGQNLLDSPEVVGADHNGTLYIYDKGNKYFRIVDPVTKIMSTMIHGSCRLDYTTLQYDFAETATYYGRIRDTLLTSDYKDPLSKIKKRVPFGLRLKPMICFRNWMKLKPKVGPISLPDEHFAELPKVIELLEPEMIMNGYDEYGPDFNFISQTEKQA